MGVAVYPSMGHFDVRIDRPGQLYFYLDRKVTLSTFSRSIMEFGRHLVMMSLRYSLSLSFMRVGH